MTAFFGLLEPSSGKLRYVSAGHNPALLRRADGTVEKLESTGVPMGMFPNATWRETSLELEPQDLLCVYTDGVTEALNADEEEFGMERLAGLLDAEPPDVICGRVFDAVGSFAADVPQYDETLLLVKRTR